MVDYFDDSADYRRQQKNTNFSWRQARIPAIFSLCAFVCFVIIYLLLTVWAIAPLYLFGLIFIIPCLALALIAYLAGKGRIGNSSTVIFTAILVPVSILASFFCMLMLSLSQTSVTVTNVSRYERTMRLGGYSRKEQLAVFPEKIPADAKNATFYYSEDSWLEYSQTVVLQFSAEAETIDNYTEKFVRLAVQIESAANKTVLEKVDARYINNLSADYRLYIIINEGSHDRKVSAVFISKEKSDIIFYAYEMRW